MRQPKRYTIHCYPHGIAKEDSKGTWVGYDDYAALAAELERLKEAWVDKKMEQDRDSLAAENERLHSYINEIECIGDDLAGMVGHADVTGDAHQMMLELYDSWLAAKEGRDAK